VNRRSFLDAVLGIGFVSTIVAVAYPVWRYLIPPASAVVAAQASQLKANSGMVFKFGSKPGLLVRAPDGELHAFNAVCTHLECTVQYKADTSTIWCACHNGMYDLQGNVISGPPPRPLERLVVNQRNNDVVVSRA
jgi:cytochrome b6-f complex iron-sulfur subunit